MPPVEITQQQELHLLYSSHFGWLQGWLRHKLGNAFEASELAQDTCISVLTAGMAPQRREARPFLAAHCYRRQALDAYADAWSRGQMIVDEVTLGAFIAELSRYRPGILQCAPEVAQLRLSGVLPLADTQRILSMLPNSLPVQVRSRTRYWVTPEAAR